MLVLSRKENERIKLGDSITVTVVRVTGDKVRLGIEAPANVLVLREELELASCAGTQQPPTDAAAVLADTAARLADTAAVLGVGCLPAVGGP